MKKKNAFIISTLTVMTLTLSACGNQTDASAKDQVTGNTPVVEETTEDAQQPEVETEVEVEPTEEVTEPVEEATTEKPKAEMVDFEI